MANILADSVGPGPYSPPHLVFLAIIVPLFVVGLILVIKFVKKEKSIRLLVVILSAVLLALVITNRIAYTYQRVVEFNGVMVVDGRELHYNWGYLVPETFCALTAFFLPIAVICFKKDNLLLHALVYFGLISGIFSSVYPAYLNKQGFFELGTMTSLIDHFVLAFLALVILIKKYMTPSIKKWYMIPAVYVAFILIALFDVHVLKTPDYEAMSIYCPLVSSLPHLSRCYCIGPALTIGMIIILIFYERFKNKKPFKTVFREMVFISDKPSDKQKR